MQLSDSKLIRVFSTCKKLGCLPLLHAENGDLIDFLSKRLYFNGISGPEGHMHSRPEEVEAEAVHRAITLADLVGCPLYVVHLTSKQAADEIARARSRGVVVFGETTAAAIGRFL